MSRLGDIENSLVSRLAAAMSGGSPVFVTAEGLTGGHRRAVREALHRARTPAAFVAFVDEPTAPETAADRLGPRFAVLLVARALRTGSDPRHGDGDAAGAFELLDQVRTQLDGFAPVSSTVAVNMRERFVEADERTAVYESLYRIEPVPAEAQAPPTPANLQVFMGDGPDDVDLSWQAGTPTESTGDVEFQNIYRKRPSDDDFVLQEAVSKDGLSMTLSGQPTGETLQYHLSAENGGGESGTSNVVSIML